MIRWWKLRKLNKQAEKEYIKTLEKNIAFWKNEAHKYSKLYWELKSK